MSGEILFHKSIINETQKELVNEVLTPKELSSCKIDLLEQEMKKFTKASYAIATNNETSAMHLSLCALSLKRGDKILCSVNTSPFIPEAIRHFDAEAIFIDINCDDYNISLDDLEKYLEKHNSKKLKALVISHIGGQATNLTRLYEIVHKYSIKVVEDATNAMNATYKGEPIGSIKSDITIFSFHPNSKYTKIYGGVLVCNEKALYDRAKLLMNHAMVTNHDYESQLDYIYDVVDIGFDYAISELDAAYCLGALRTISKTTKRHKEIAKIYNQKLASAKHISIPVVTQDHSYNLYIIKIDKNRDSFARDLEIKGIYTGLHYIPLHLLSYYKKKYNLRVNAYPRALKTYQQILSLPIYESLTNSEVDYICKSILEIDKDRK